MGDIIDKMCIRDRALMKQKNINMPVYSDSRNALSWVKQKKCKTKLERTPKTEELFQMIERAENWLKNNACLLYTSRCV